MVDIDRSASNMAGFTEHVMDMISTSRRKGDKPGKVVVVTDDRIGEIEVSLLASALNGTYAGNLPGLQISGELGEIVLRAIENREVIGLATRSPKVVDYLKSVGTFVGKDGETIAYIREGKRYEFF